MSDQTLGSRLPEAIRRMESFLGSERTRGISNEFIWDMMAIVAAAKDAGLRPIETAPKDGTFILLFGPSGYVSTLLRCAVARWDAEYRPNDPWVDYGGECFSSSGKPPTHWMPLPKEREVRG